MAGVPLGDDSATIQNGMEAPANATSANQNCIDPEVTPP